MSCDVDLWGKKRPVLSRLLPSAEGWKKDEDGWLLEKRNWLLRVGAPVTCEPEDVPRGVLAALPGAKWSVSLTLEPIGAPRSAYETLGKTAERIAISAEGLVEDPASGKAWMAATGKEIELEDDEPEPDRDGAVAMSFWYLGSPLRTRRGARALLRLLEKHAPEAVPRRYDFSRYTKKTGLDALVDYIATSTRGSHGTFLDAAKNDWILHVADEPEAEADPAFRSCLLSVTLPAGLLAEPGREASLRALWRGLAKLLRPFYADVRHLPPLAGLPGTQAMHPVHSWFFRGLPEPGIAFLLGPPYLDLWKPKGAVLDDGSAFVEHPRWAALKSVDASVPARLALPEPSRWVKKHGSISSHWGYGYPKTWPFDRKAAAD